MFIKIITSLSILSTTLTGVAIIQTQPGDSLYPLKVKIVNWSETYFNIGSDKSTQSQITSTHSGGIKIIWDININN